MRDQLQKSSESVFFEVLAFFSEGFPLEGLLLPASYRAARLTFLQGMRWI